MKKISGENIAVIIVTIVIFAVTVFTCYNVISNSNALTSNEIKNNISNTNQNTMSTKNNSDNNNNNDNNIDSTTDNSNIENENNDIADNSSDNLTADASLKENTDNKSITKEITENISQPEKEQIATYTTTIYDKDEGRIQNIQLSTSKLNDAIIHPNEEFSFNTRIGPMDESQGFKKALGFDGNGNKIQISGGGICQLSSTLYNSALIANLEITERHPHSHRVYYVPVDKDATILYGTYDLKFKNNTNNDIKIEASTDSVNVTVTLYKIK